MTPALRQSLSTRALTAFAAWLCACMLASTAGAQFTPSALVVRGPGVAAPIRDGAAEALAGVAEVTEDDGYITATQEFGLEPTSEQAIVEVGTKQFVALIVVLERQGKSLSVTYRSGKSGELVHALTIEPLGKHLTPEQQAQIGDGAQQALSFAGGAVPPPAAAGVSGAPADGLPEPIAGDLPPPSEGMGELPLPPPEEDAQPSLAEELAAGGGIGMRDIETPSNGGPRSLSTGVYPLAEVALRVASAPRGRFYFAFSGRYQTSVFLEGNETPSGGVPRKTTMRSHHGELGVMPGFRFSDKPQSTIVGLYLGWDVRALGLVDELSLPSYSLHGPCFRPEFLISLGEDLQLRLAPEVIVLTSISKDMRDLAAIDGVGLGLGGEAALRFQLFEAMAVALTFRESHVSAATEFQVSFDDAERLITVQAVLLY